MLIQTLDMKIKLKHFGCKMVQVMTMNSGWKQIFLQFRNEKNHHIQFLFASKKFRNCCSMSYWRTLSELDFSSFGFLDPQKRLWKVKQDAIPVIPNLCPHFMARVGSLSCQFEIYCYWSTNLTTFLFFLFYF